MGRFKKNMYTIGVKFLSGVQRVDTVRTKPNKGIVSYESIYISSDDPNILTKVFASGDFILDWFDATNYLVLHPEIEDLNVHSTVVSFLKNSQEYRQMVLVMNNETNELYLREIVDEDDDDSLYESMSYFIGAEWTRNSWEALKFYCENVMDVLEQFKSTNLEQS
jgi:hypothetical protein